MAGMSAFEPWRRGADPVQHKKPYQTPSFMEPHMPSISQVTDKVPKFPNAGPAFDPNDPLSVTQHFMPEYQGMMQDGQLGDQYKIGSVGQVTPGQVQHDYLNPQRFNANQDALNAMKQRSMDPGDSPWLKLQNQKQGFEETAARDRAAQQALAGSRQAESALAMRGGLGGGARERMAQMGGRNLSAMHQGIGRDSAMRRAQLGIADDQTKMAMLSQIPGYDLRFADQKANLEKYNLNRQFDVESKNIGNQMQADRFNTQLGFDQDRFNALSAQQGNQDLNRFNMDKFGHTIDAYSAGKVSDALGNRANQMGGGGGIRGFGGDRLDAGGWMDPTNYF